jgi:hypothetical protein
LFLLAVVLPGILGPFAIDLVSGAYHIFMSEQLFGEGSNWRGKIDFLQLGNALFTRFAPQSAPILVSHNVVLDTYVRYGYLLLLPLLFQFFAFVRMSLSAQAGLAGVAVVIVLLNHVLAVPGALFAPSGVMCQMLLVGVAFHRCDARRKGTAAS